MADFSGTGGPWEGPPGRGPVGGFDLYGENPRGGMFAQFKRGIFFVLGLTMMAVGFISVFLPIMPTVPFIIIAGWSFARSSPRAERWLLEHKWFGPMLRAWRERGAVPRNIKILAVAGLSVGYGFFWFAVQPGWAVAAMVAVVMIGVGLYVVTRPSA